jgi:hypothetical protein
MDDKKFIIMNIASNILASYYSNKVSFCFLNKREPTDAEKDELLKGCLSMFENLAESYMEDIQEIAGAIK